MFYISRTDAWSENMRLLKLGRVRVKFTPGLQTAGGGFRQELRLSQGVLTVSDGENVNIKVWVDANQPDVLLDNQTDRIAWYHRDDTSIWPITMQLRGLEGFITKSGDPLLGRTFGGVLQGGRASLRLGRYP